ncbi:MAG TPA: sigma-70 family RNA polymerase sigma factor, partial [Bacteroidales bacterium]|nr:sigma-70 family RNA polymerase sigma factor [Bacteroidales bacterium]
MPETTDDPILLLIRDKATQRRGFDLLVRIYSGKVYDLVRRMLIDHDDSNDVVQEIFLRIWQNLDRFRGESSLFTWIYRISVNEALAFLRKKQLVNWLRFESYEKVLAGRLVADPWFDGDRAEARP